MQDLSVAGNGLDNLCRVPQRTRVRHNSVLHNIHTHTLLYTNTLSWRVPPPPPPPRHTNTHMQNAVTNSNKQSGELREPCHTFGSHAHGMVCRSRSLSEEDVMHFDRIIKINNELEVC